ncbi:MAG: hypothetical protein ACTSWA_01425 [Candidatus Thorarchaeota archaeon]
MASIWMLSKDAMRGMNIVGAISDFLDEIQREGHPTSESRNRVICVLENLISGARSYIDSNIRVDSFSMITAEAVLTEMTKTPTEFISILENCVKRIRVEEENQNNCLDILRLVAKNTMQVTSRRVDTKSLILH